MYALSYFILTKYLLNKVWKVTLITKVCLLWAPSVEQQWVALPCECYIDFSFIYNNRFIKLRFWRASTLSVLRISIAVYLSHKTWGKYLIKSTFGSNNQLCKQFLQGYGNAVSTAIIICFILSTTLCGTSTLQKHRLIYFRNKKRDFITLILY